MDQPVQELKQKTSELSLALAAADHAELVNSDLKAELRQTELHLQLKQACP